MERLTEKHYLAEEHYMKCSEDCNVDMDCIDCPAFDKIVERLAAYEDTGLTPEEVTAAKVALMGKTLAEITEFEGVPLARLRELAEADKGGRVVVLPCKVYETDGVRVYEHTVREVIYETAGGPAFDKNAIGKSIFLTRAEAERALQEMEGKKDG